MILTGRGSEDAIMYRATGLGIIFSRLFAATNLFLLCSASIAAGPWYVDTNGDDAADCLSVATACASINRVLEDSAFGLGDTVRVAIGTYTSGFSDTEVVLLNRSSTLSGGWNSDFTVQAGMSTIDGEQSRRGILITGEVNVEIDRFLVTKGLSGDGGGIGIDNGVVMISNSTISGSSAFGGGGLWISSADVTLVDSVVSNNNARNIGGGILNQGGAILTMLRTSIRNNSAGPGDFDFGGGIYNLPQAFINAYDSEFSNNEASAGGAIYTGGDTLLTNTTISGNLARSSGGGIYQYDQNAILTLNNVTISNNVAGSFYGGLYSHVNTSTTMRNTIIADNDAPNSPDCQALTPINSAGYNLIGDLSDCGIVTTVGDILDGNVAIDALADNGGPTQSQALFETSEAVDACDPGGCRDGNYAIITTDQRGTARPQGESCDIGAYEGAIPAPVFNPQNFLPLQSGNQWTYQWNDSPGLTSTAIVLEGTVVVNGAATKVMEFDELGFISRNFLTNDNDGIRLHRSYDDGDTMTFSPPITMATSASTIGVAIEGSGSVNAEVAGLGTFLLDYTSKSRIIRQQFVTVPAGNYLTVKVELKTTISGTIFGSPMEQVETDTYWLTEFLGAVKSEVEVDEYWSLSELVSTNVDWDGDGVPSDIDVCPGISNPNQLDFDEDGIGDVCDDDDDNDGVADVDDAFPLDPDETLDTDGDGIGNNADPDDDGDGIPDEQDDYPLGRFDDVPSSHWASPFIEALASAGITAGCGGGNYCPGAPVTRSQMAVFLERGMNGSGYSPPAASGTVFSDVGAGDFAASFIEKLAADGITAGCGNNNYCPNAEVTRDQMAVFLLRAKHGSTYSPPTASGVFGDVATNHWAAPWIEQLAAEGTTAGCGGGNYCPGNEVTRDQMAVFLVRTFGL